MEIHILRLSHRLPRDERITTHVALVARAFGAKKLTYTGQKDQGFEESIKRICDKWGGIFPVTYEKSYSDVISNYKEIGFEIIHLTMYGDSLDKLEKKDKALVIIGSEHVPSDVFHLSNQNISIGSQPHSEVAALAIVLDRLIDWKGIDFKGKIKVVPTSRGKKTIKTL